MGRALVYSVTARQARRVVVYGKEGPTNKYTEGERWNGRVILTLSETYTEPISDLRPWYSGQENKRLTGLQQAATDFRISVARRDNKTPGRGETKKTGSI